MIDFKNSSFVKLKPVNYQAYSSMISPFLLDDEKIIATYQAMRDGVVFTDLRIIAINVQGLTGTKKDFTSLYYSKIQAFSIETAGILDNDSELDVWFSGLGNVRFEFTKGTNISAICKLISSKVR